MSIAPKHSCSSIALAIALLAPAAGYAQVDATPSAPPNGVAQAQITTDPQSAQDGGDEVIVTGSLIRGTAKDTALPVDVIDQAMLEKRGQPTVLDIIRTLPASGAVIGETNLINAAGAGYVGSATANLRGLGANRTLVLMNGRRLAAYQTGVVDVNLIPLAAIGRVEVLKDGAAATYGSDAIAGVVNFITRERYNGVDLTADHRIIADSDGDTNLGATAGFSRGSVSLLVSAGFQRRSRISNRDRDFAFVPYFQNPQGGWSQNSNPGTFRRVNAAGTQIAGPVIDPQCAVLGNVALNPSTCLYTYTPFDDLVEPHSRFQFFSSLDVDIADGLKLHLEGLYANTQAISNQSPSYTPSQYPTGAVLNPGAPAVPNRHIVPCNNPGLQDMFTKNPAFAAAIGGAGCINAPNAPAGSFTAVAGWRINGVLGSLLTGDSRYTDRHIQLYRITGGLSGRIGGFADWDISATHTENQSRSYGADALVNRVQLALAGFGGPNCTGTTPGANGCQWLNPFSNAVGSNRITGATNPQFNPAVANSRELAAWLEESLRTRIRNELTVVEGVLSGRIGFFSLPGGDIGWAVGGQYRRVGYRSEYGYFNDLTRTPCTDSVTNPAATCATPQGPFNSIAASLPIDTSRDVRAAFGELNLPVFDSLNVQAALRYEDYGGGVGSTTNPKVAAKWQIFSALAIRGSFGTTFRGPTPVNLDPAPIATLSAVTAAGGTSKIVDFFGNPNLKPEKATNANVGVIVQVGRFAASVDYYRFRFTDAIVAPFYDAIASSVVPVPNGLANCSAPLRERITFEGGACVQGVTTGANILRVRADLINGPRTETSGVDFDASLGFGLLGGDMALTANATYVIDYSVGATSISGVALSPAYEAAGFLNDDRGGNSLPRFKAYGRFDYTIGGSTIGGGLRYIGRYRDNRTAIFTAASPLGQVIAPTALVDFNYVLRLQPVTLSLTIENVFDRDPSFARTAYSYDTFVGNPLGRTFKLGVRGRF